MTASTPSANRYGACPLCSKPYGDGHHICNDAFQHNELAASTTPETNAAENMDTLANVADMYLHSDYAVSARNAAKIIRKLEQELAAMRKERDEAKAEADRLRARIAECEKDTARYRFMRETLRPQHFCAYMGYHPNEAELWDKNCIDNAIDEAIAAGAKNG